MPPRMSQANEAARRPLAGLLVVDLTRVLAGPFCTLVLAELGARVIKVERPGPGDDARSVGPHIHGKSAYFMSLNRGKESIALDLGVDADRAVFEKLVARADVLVENYRPGVLAKLGYAWETLHARWPRLVVASISGFGQTGPYAPRPAFDMVVQAMGGVMSLTGHPGGPPTRVGTSIGDITAGLFGASGILAALYERAATGVGRRVDVAMLDAQVAILENAIARYAATGQRPRPRGTPRRRHSRRSKRPTSTWCSPPATTRSSRRSAPRSTRRSSSRIRASRRSPTGSRTPTRSARSSRSDSPRATPPTGWSASSAR